MKSRFGKWLSVFPASSGRQQRTDQTRNLMREVEVGESGNPIYELADPANRRLLLLASSGGHLSELVKLVPSHQWHSDTVWATFDTKQAQSLLGSATIVYVPYIAPRGVWRTLRASLTLTMRLRGHSRFDGCVSTGSAIAIPGFAWARLHRVECVYIESLARRSTLSTTARLIRRLKLAAVYSQSEFGHPDLPQYKSLLLGFVNAGRDVSGRNPMRIAVSIGTIEGFRFDALISRVRSITNGHDVELRWQLGSAKYESLPGIASKMLSEEDLKSMFAWADVVICHAGVGTVLSLLEMGVCPVVVPRRHHRHEHIDDHQLELCSLLDEHGIGVVREVDVLEFDDLCLANRRMTRRADNE